MNTSISTQTGLVQVPDVNFFREQSSRIEELEGLRGVAALSVLVYHYICHYHKLYGHPFLPPQWLQVGVFGYHLFFILSGFLILRSLENGVSVVSFLKKRAFRLYPTFWVSAIITYVVIYSIGLPGRERTFHELVLNLTMLPHLFGVSYIDGVYWTLTYELSFYVGIALLFASGALRRFEFAVAVWLGLQITILGISWGVWRKPPQQPWDSLLLARYGNLFVLGMLLHRILDRGPNRGSNSLIWRMLSSVTAIEWTIIVWAVGMATIVDPPSLIILPLIIIVFLLIPYHSSLVAPLHWSGLRYIGVVSYPLYLIHQNMGYALIRQGYLHGWSAFPAIGFAIVTSFLVAMGLHYLIEVPGIKVGKWRGKNFKFDVRAAPQPFRRRVS